MKIFKSFAGFSGARAVEALCMFGLLSLYSHVFSPAEFGKIAIIQIFISILCIIVDARMNTVFSIKYYKDTKVTRNKRLYNSLAFNTFLAGILLTPLIIIPGIITALLALPESTDPSLIRASLFLVFSRVMYNFFTNLLVISNKPKMFLFTTLTFVSIYCLTASIYYIGFNGEKISMVFWSQIIALSVCLSYSLIYYQRHYRLSKFSLDITLIKNSLVIAIPLIPTAMVSMVQASADRYILNAAGYAEAVGILAVASRFPGLIMSLIIYPMGQALTPLTFMFFSQGKSAFKIWQKDVIALTTQVLAVISLIFPLILWLLFPFFIDSDFNQSMPIAALLVANICFQAIGQGFSATLLVSEKTQKTFFVSLVGMLSNILLNLLFIPKWGLIGAVIASLICSCVETILYYFHSQKILKINYRITPFVVPALFVICGTITPVLVSTFNMNLLIAQYFIAVVFLLALFIFWKFAEFKNPRNNVITLINNTKTT